MKKVTINKPLVTYEDILNLTRNRLEVIHELSMEDEAFNLEWRLLKNVEDQLWKLTKLQKLGLPGDKKDKKVKRPVPSEMNPPMNDPMDLLA